MKKHSEKDSGWVDYVSAVRGNDVDAVVAVLAEHPEWVNGRCAGSAHDFGQVVGEDPADAEKSSPPLHHSVLMSYCDMAEQLLKHGADIHALAWDENHGHAQVLTLAAWMGSAEVLELVLRYGAEPNTETGVAHPALYTAAEHGNTQKLNVLEKYGARHDVFTSAITGDLSGLKKIVDEVPKLTELKSRRGRTVMEEAIFHGRNAVVEFLTGCGFEVNLEVAIVTGNREAVRAFIQSDLSQLNPRGLPESEVTPLMLASKSGQKEMVQLLIDLGADVHLGAGEEWCYCQPIHCATASTVAVLVRAGADVNRVYRNCTPLQRSRRENRDPELIKELLSHGAIE